MSKNKKENSKNYIPGLKISVAEVMAIQATFKSWSKLWKKEYKKSGLYSKDAVDKVFEDLFLKKKLFSRILKAKNEWVNQLDTELNQYQNKLAWNIRFMKGSTMIGRG